MKNRLLHGDNKGYQVTDRWRLYLRLSLLSMACQKVFAGQFHNEDTEVHAWSEVEGVAHYRWLQGPMNHLPREQQFEFIADVMRQIFIFLRWY